MANNKIIKRKSRPLTYLLPLRYSNKYSLGGDIVSGLKSSSGAIGTVAGQVGGSLIGGGLESGAGSAVNNIGGTIGSAVGAVNPLLGGIITAGSGIVGGLVNRAFGSKMNTEEINRVESSNKALNQTLVDSSTNDSVASQWSSMDFGKDFSKSDIGKDGWFSSKAANKYNALKLQLNVARNRAMSALEQGVNTADTNADLLIQRNFSAYGGIINMADNLPMSPFGNRFDDGGSIHINPANKGKFNATKKKTGKSTEELTHSKNPLTRKRAIFALNAAKWHHALGGELNLYAIGGDLKDDSLDGMLMDDTFSNGLTYINNGGTHEENPDGGVLMGVDGKGVPNLVEEGEVKWNNYIFSNRLALDKELLTLVSLPLSLADHTFASAAERLGKESKERPNDPISLRGLNDSLSKLALALEAMRKQQKQDMNTKKYSKGGTLYADGSLLQSPKGLDTSYLRYAPVIGSGLAALSDAMGWTNKPDYSNADRILDSVNSIKPVTYTPVSNYLRYNPFDRNFYTNKLAAQANATRRSIMDESGGNRATALAGILATDYNTQGRYGDLARLAEEYNQGLKERVETFNRGTDQFNSELSMRAQTANLNIDRLRFEATSLAARLRDEVDSRSAAAKSANLSNFFNNIGAVGQESFSRNMVKSNPGLYYGIDANGNISYKSNTKACGGLLTVKKGRRR